jgi:uncharacterized protein YjbJ (UPF0337 family)
MNQPKTSITLGVIGLSGALLLGCDNQSQEMSGEPVREEVGEALEESREAASAAAEKAGEATDEAIGQAREAIEETGDRIESATD